MARRLPFQVLGQCIDCGKSFERDAGAWRCWPCDTKVQEIRLAARRIVSDAVRAGLLPPLKSVVCVDCEAPAVAYDHRDYRRPLAVAPVCLACNSRRGPAAWRKQSRISEGVPA